MLEDLSKYCFETTGYKVDFISRWWVNQVKKHIQNGRHISKSFCVKFNHLEPLYVFQNGMHKRTQILNQSQLSLLLKPIDSGFAKNDDTSIGFYDKWSNDIDHRLYRTMDFIPYNKKNHVADNNVFNLFEGFNEDIYGERVEQSILTKKITPYLDLVQELCGGDDEHAMYFHKFIGQIFQDPSHKAPTCTGPVGN